MRTHVLVTLAVAVMLSRSASSRADEPSSRTDDIARARALDQQGVREFQGGHYNDAIRYFEEAKRLGGPSTELWNIARCHMKLDDPEEANRAFERYLAQGDLSPQDRAEAKEQLEELRHRRSTVTIASSPMGAYVAVDGRRMGRTPMSTEVAPGQHTIAVERAGYPPHVQRVEARLGRAIIVDARLVPDRIDEPGGASPSGERVRRFTASLAVGVLAPRLGGVGTTVHPAAFVGLGYVAVDSGTILLSVGARGSIAYDTWGNTVAAPALACGIPSDESAVALSAFLDATLGYRLSPSVRIGGDLGFGFAAYTESRLGGDLFTPSCSASPGIQPALHAGLDVSYSFTRALRGVLSPMIFELAPAFAGARTSPIDASEAWTRLGGALGLAIDL